jgi:flagellar biosynthesis protein FlgN
MDAQACREHLAGVLAEEVSLLGELIELLERERDVIGAKDIDALRQTTRARQERLGALARLEEQRRSLCSLHGHSADRAGLTTLLAWCDPSGSLSARLGECVRRAARCQELNDQNGLLVAARMQRVEGLLEALTGRTRRRDVYGPRGFLGPARPARELGAA